MVSGASSQPQYCNHPGFAVYGVQSYIGVPLYRRDRSVFGTLCALDTNTVDLSEDHLQTFHLLAKLVSYEMEAEENRIVQQKALEEAQKTTKMRDQFIGILGHELRNPLNAMTIAASILQDDTELSPENRMLSNVIQSSSKRMAHLIEDTLDLTRSQIGNGITVSPSSNDMNDVCLPIINELRVSSTNREIIFESKSNCVGFFDEYRAAQVISNLLSNALHHGAPNQPVRLTLREDESHIFVDIHNFGKPIPPEIQEFLFNPFKRGALAKEEAIGQQGLGLGLYIAREIVRAHDGDIVLTSDENGTTFTTRWPRRAVS